MFVANIALRCQVLMQAGGNLVVWGEDLVVVRKLTGMSSFKQQPYTFLRDWRRQPRSEKLYKFGPFSLKMTQPTPWRRCCHLGVGC